MLLLFLICVPLHLTSRLVFGRSGWPQRFLAAAAWIVGARVRRVGPPVRGPALLVANHVSWIDILALADATGCAFVSKDQLGHPFIHWLADQNRTIYINRSAKRKIGEQAGAISQALAEGRVVAFFPEGTVGPGDRLLPFRAPLFAALSDAPPETQVRPVAVDYGAQATEISWHGQDGRDNVVRILGRRGTIAVTVRVLDPLEAGDRKWLASHAREAIDAALGFKSGSHSPIAGGE